MPAWDGLMLIAATLTPSVALLLRPRWLCRLRRAHLADEGEACRFCGGRRP